jgi:hypothetical protein
LIENDVDYSEFTEEVFIVQAFWSGLKH